MAVALSEKSAVLSGILRSIGKIGVAFSGGVDSSILLASAADALGTERVIGFTVHSELVPGREKRAAEEIAGFLRVRHVRVACAALEDGNIAANSSERCYHCKKRVFSLLRQRARDEGLAALVHGDNCDDARDYRPGRKAAEELGVRAPLVEAGLGKAEIRELARLRGLPNWDAPSLACLATRVPYGTPLSEEALRRIDLAEEFLIRRFSLRQVRVRDHGTIARIEVAEPEIRVLIDGRAAILEELGTLGWKYVTADLGAFRSGSMNGLRQ